MSDIPAAPVDGDRLAKVMARSGLCSRRDAEGWIKDGRVSVNGRTVLTPAFNVSAKDVIKVDGEVLAERQGTRVWLYHKPAGLVVTEKDPEGRPTVFESFEEKGLPRVVTIGRLDINTEGLLLLTNDGGLKRILELPSTGWLRRYRVRAFGTVTQEQLNGLADGTEIDGIKYGPIEAILERQQGANVWLVLSLREGKNREVKNVLGALGLEVNRLIRVSYGPFQLGDLPEGEVVTVNARVLKDQLGRRLAEASGADFESDLPEVAAQKRANPKLRAAAPGKVAPAGRRKPVGLRFRFEDDTPESQRPEPVERPRKDRPGRFDAAPRPAAKPVPRDEGQTRRVFRDDGSVTEIKVRPPRRERISDEDKPFGVRPEGGDRPPRKFDDKPRSFGDKKPYAPRGDGDRPARPYGDKKPYSPRGDGDKPRSFGEKKPYAPRGDGDRPARPYGDKKPYSPRGDGAARPARPFGDKKPYAPRGDGSERPARSFEGKKPYAPRGEGAERPARSFGDRKPYAPRGDGAERPARSFEGKKPYAPRDGGDKPFGGKPGGKMRAPRPNGDRPARSFGDKPRGFGGKPAGGPRGPRPGGGGGGRPFGGKPARPKPTRG